MLPPRLAVFGKVKLVGGSMLNAFALASIFLYPKEHRKANPIEMAI
jgi:hypothetical protein